MNRKILIGARILLGLIFVVFGLNGFLQFLPVPPMPEGAAALGGAMAASGYMFPMIKGTEIICGLALLSGCWAALALVILAPITLNIFAFHMFLTPGLENLIMPTAIIVLQFLAARLYWDKYKPLLKSC